MTPDFLVQRLFKLGEATCYRVYRLDLAPISEREACAAVRSSIEDGKVIQYFPEMKWATSFRVYVS